MNECDLVVKGVKGESQFNVRLNDSGGGLVDWTDIVLHSPRSSNYGDI